jgi:hypothetical protein
LFSLTPVGLKKSPMKIFVLAANVKKLFSFVNDGEAE